MVTSIVSKRCAPAILAVVLAVPASGAQLSDPVRAMIEAARDSGDAETFAAVVAIAKQTNPDHLAEIESMEAAFRAAKDAEAARLAAEKKRALSDAGVFDNWAAKGEFGAFHASGNSNSVGVTASLALTREGIDWSHKLQARADYQRSNGLTTREQVFAAYEPRFQIDEGLFAYGLAQYESDRFQGYTARYAASGGLGYKVVDAEAIDLAIKAGPAFRRTDFVTGAVESSLAALAAFDFDWRISDTVTFTQDSNVVAETGGNATLIVGGANTTLNLISGLDAKISDSLTTRFSYSVDYNSDPPAGSVSTDALTRFTIVYDF